MPEFEAVRRSCFLLSELLAKQHLYLLAFEHGMTHFKRGSVDKALEQWHIAAGILPDKAIAYYHLGEAYRTNC